MRHCWRLVHRSVGPHRSTVEAWRVSWVLLESGSPGRGDRQDQSGDRRHDATLRDCRRPEMVARPDRPESGQPKMLCLWHQRRGVTKMYIMAAETGELLDDVEIMAEPIRPFAVY